MLGSVVDLNLMSLEPCSEWSAWHSCMSNLSPKPRAISQIRDKQAVYDVMILPLM